jgi:general secretion pathway protein A
MYEQFFGLADAPFRLTPDPRYLFLSKKHAEGLAHLKLSLRESSGFVCITGDVGTGKTTLLRAFLTTLGPDVATAYVFNPALSALELLQTINSEFGLPATSSSPKVLTDDLNRHLLRQREAGRRSIVVIDEAQALQVDVLEQLRLLSNLETTTEKLLRIILVGQPQLRTLLLHPELVQLNQRITLRWHLGPLAARETVAYVRHRLDVAGGGTPRRLFTRRAVRRLHRYAYGVPRLVNMIAHRALLAAFAADRPRVGAGFVRQAYREIGAVPLPVPAPPRRRPAVWAAAAAVAGAAVALGVATELGWRPPAVIITEPAAAPVAAVPAPDDVARAEPVPDGDGVARVALAVPPADAPPVAAPAASEEPPADDAPATDAAAAPPPADAPAAAPAATPAAAPPPVPIIEVEQRLVQLDEQASARQAVAGLLAAWHAEPLEPGEAVALTDLAPVAQRRGLEAFPLLGNTSMLRLLDLPAVLALRVPPAGAVRWATVVGLDAGRLTLALDGEPVVVDAALLDRDWFGQAALFWRDFESLGPTFGADGTPSQVSRLQALLARAELLRGAQPGRWDAATAQAVLDFQRSRLLAVDGRVGRFTRIVLYAAVGGYPRPTLVPGAAS